MRMPWRAAAASLLLLASLLAVIFGQTRESALAQSKASLDGKAYVLNRQIAQTFAKVDVVLRLVARDYPRFSALPAAAANAELKALLDTIPESQSLRIADASGRFRFDASGTLPQVDIADRAYFRQHQSDPGSGLVFSEPIFARITNNWVVTLSRRLNNPDGSHAGHVQAAINAGDFNRLFAGINRAAAEEIVMLDRRGGGAPDIVQAFHLDQAVLDGVDHDALGDVGRHLAQQLLFLEFSAPGGDRFDRRGGVELGDVGAAVEIQDHGVEVHRGRDLAVLLTILRTPRVMTRRPNV